MYIRVPAVNGVPQVGKNRVVLGKSISPDEAIVIIEGSLQSDWIELTESEYLALGGDLPCGVCDTGKS